MSARKLRNSWWVDFRNAGKRIRKKSPENSFSGAKAFETLLRQRLSHGQCIDFNAEKEEVLPTFEEFSKRWFDTYVITNNKVSEQNAKRVVLIRHLIPLIGWMRIDAISDMTIEEYKARKVKEGLANKTINNHLTVLSKCLHMAQEWLNLSKCPKIRLLKVPPQAFDFLTYDESVRLLSAINDPQWYAAVYLALRTGLRLGELLGLRWSDIDLEQKRLMVRRSVADGVESSPKSNRERFIPLTTPVCALLHDIKRPSGPVLRSKKGAKFLYRSSPLRILQGYCREAGIRPVGWHTLRHTFASELVTRGISLRAVQELLGHSDIRTSMRYAHLAPSYLHEAVSVLEQGPRMRFIGQPAGNG